MIKSRVRVKGARDLAEVSEGLRIVVRREHLPTPLEISQYRDTGRNKTPGILPSAFPTNSEERHDQHASYADLRLFEVQLAIRVSPATGI